MTERNSKGQFVKGNQAGKRGYQALIEKRFKGDKLAFRAYLSGIGKRGWEGLVRKQFAGKEEIAVEYVIALSNYAYGMCYFNKATQSYPHWVKECFRTHPGTPEEFYNRHLGKLNFSLDSVGEQSF